MSSSASAIADRYIGRDGGAPVKPRWKRPGRVAGEIVKAESVEDILDVATLLYDYTLAGRSTGERRAGEKALAAFARLVGVAMEDLEREVRSRS